MSTLSPGIVLLKKKVWIPKYLCGVRVVAISAPPSWFEISRMFRISFEACLKSDLLFSGLLETICQYHSKASVGIKQFYLAT